MLPLLRLSVPFVLFPAASAAVFRFAPPFLRLPLFALVNVLGMLGLCLLTPITGLYFWQLKAYLAIAFPIFAIYVLTVVLHYVLMRAFARKRGWIPWTAFLFPIVVMMVVKYVPGISEPFQQPLAIIGKRHVAEFFIGVSYMAFRLSHLVMEVRNEIVPAPTLWEHLCFAFFVPTLAVGPISRYSIFRKSLYHPDRKLTPLARSAQRMLVGLTKYLFLATLVEQLSYGGLLMDSHPHPWVDLPIAAVAFYLYLYLNFSGYCDMAIGAAGLVGIRVEENFDQPFRSRNMQEFWTRWHITLSNYMKDMVFTPISKALVRRLGPRFSPHAIAFAILTVFLAMGAWHGLVWNYLVYGALHGVGVVTCHYYTLWLTKRLGKKGHAAYNRNPLIRAAGVVVTFLFVAGTLFFFANGSGNIRTIMGLLR
jgi:D-alanyl-lipoteichoic acid acyltransferase DltB (MBOAT superfamily)